MDMAITPTAALNRSARRAIAQAARRQPPAPAHEVRVSTAAASRLLNSTTPFTDEAADEVLLYAHAALLAMRTGDGTDAHFGALANLCNIGSLLAARGVGAEAANVFEDAQRALLSVRARYVDKGRYGFAGPEYCHLCDALANHEIQLRDAKQETVRDAIHEARARIEAKDVLTAADLFAGVGV